MPKIKWLDEPQAHDYPAAGSYLALVMTPHAANAAVEALQHVDAARFAAKDIFRASGLPLLGADNSHVETDRTQIVRKARLSPLLLVVPSSGGHVVIADGYHRLCAAYTFDEDAMIPCRIVHQSGADTSVAREIEPRSAKNA